jgi:hypothetical protein
VLKSVLDIQDSHAMAQFRGVMGKVVAAKVLYMLIQIGEIFIGRHGVGSGRTL